MEFEEMIQVVVVGGGGGGGAVAGGPGAVTVASSEFTLDSACCAALRFTMNCNGAVASRWRLERFFIRRPLWGRRC